MDPTWQSLKGQFLMAMPGLADPNFFQTVTCLSEHNPKGAMGVVINRVHPDVNAKMIFDELKIPTSIDAEQIPIYIGGPVHMNELFILHGAPFAWEGSMMITGALAIDPSAREIVVVDGVVPMRATFAMEVSEVQTPFRPAPASEMTNPWVDQLADRLRASGVIDVE